MSELNKETLKELEGLLADINITEITSHIADGTLGQWIEAWTQCTTVLICNLKENKEKT